MALHFLTDSRRFTSTVGDYIGWRNDHANYDPEGMADWKLRPLPTNPWEPISILIDQALHVAQIAFLAGVFLT